MDDNFSSIKLDFEVPKKHLAHKNKFSCLKNSLKNEIISFVNLENKIFNLSKVNKNFCKIIKKENDILISKFESIIKITGFNKKSFQKVNELLMMTDENILIDNIKFLQFYKFSKYSKFIIHSIYFCDKFLYKF